jgi:hypothetical protein
MARILIPQRTMRAGGAAAVVADRKNSAGAQSSTIFTG